ncbi:translational machinery component [Rozella allomycis CSF55]|uniref:Ribosomal protein S11 domain-containing protein n=1 Tax=Rozella allomycis (strain CSF55) TaxID=988480 RepID=A0A075AX73_ROZAC|nr:Ribosomal protein S11 domain-containing protein [Rozella allomycis CSF55]RKP17849.1 translational machinery component [Rozella allomycis CSF55]|eukprot:EPZ34744.1 Ribosomal protein S11 domain-containing protein [Rozella allomycis CSF55]
MTNLVLYQKALPSIRYLTGQACWSYVPNFPKRDVGNYHRLMVCFAMNNVFLTLIDGINPEKTFFCLSAGKVGFKNSKKLSTKCLLALLDEFEQRAKKLDIAKLKIHLRGYNTLRVPFFNQFRSRPFEIVEMMDCTPVPMNGCKPKKQRRL